MGAGGFPCSTGYLDPLPKRFGKWKPARAGGIRATGALVSAREGGGLTKTGLQCSGAPGGLTRGGGREMELIRRRCPFCNRALRSIGSHLVSAHGISASESRRLGAIAREVRFGVIPNPKTCDCEPIRESGTVVRLRAIAVRFDGFANMTSSHDISARTFYESEARKARRAIDELSRRGLAS